MITYQASGRKALTPKLTLLATFLGGAAFPGTVSAEDDVYECRSSNTDEMIQIVHYDGKSEGHITREGLDRDVMAFHGLNSMTFIVLGQDRAHTESYTVYVDDHHFTALHGDREEHGSCTVISEDNHWEAPVETTVESQHQHF